jgi:hypothetical protein
MTVSEIRTITSEKDQSSVLVWFSCNFVSCVCMFPCLKFQHVIHWLSTNPSMGNLRANFITPPRIPSHTRVYFLLAKCFRTSVRHDVWSGSIRRSDFRGRFCDFDFWSSSLTFLSDITLCRSGCWNSRTYEQPNIFSSRCWINRFSVQVYAIVDGHDGTNRITQKLSHENQRNCHFGLRISCFICAKWKVLQKSNSEYSKERFLCC